jgi:hypothetical protein
MTLHCEISDDDGPAEVWQEETRRARKPHKCCECGGMILPGQTYERVFWVFDGTAAHAETCADCREAWGIAGCKYRQFGGLSELATNATLYGSDEEIATGKKILAMLAAVRKARDQAFHEHMLRELHAMIERGEGNSEAAEALRARMDATYARLDAAGRARERELAAAANLGRV